MESLKTIYKIGYGPSSSHTMGPRKAAEQFIQKYPNYNNYRVILYGSLAATGKGHLTDVAIKNVFDEKGKHIDIVWHADVFLKKHPNAMQFEALNETNEPVIQWKAYSIGGGSIIGEEDDAESINHIYPFKNLNAVLKFCHENGLQIWEMVDQFESNEIWDYLAEVWAVMQDCIHRGLENEGVIAGVLKLPRKAANFHIKANGYTSSLRKRALLYSYALAVSEENACGGKVVTAPTCGSSGVVPSVLYYLKTEHGFSDKKILRALATAGIIGLIIKKNASISGAEVGCQGEVGTACAMASAATTQLFGGSIFQIETSAEMGLEHHLGLTCDPIAGLVQIPCIERNAFAAARALDNNAFAILGDGRHRISFDTVVETMKRTGHDLPKIYRETSEGGLAKFLNKYQHEL